MASGLSLPVGLENSTGGAIDGAIAAVVASGRGHTFLAVGPDGAMMVARTRGNRDRHVILRGGAAGANYGPAEVAEASARAAEHGLARAVMIDCSHDNSRLDVARQADVCRDVLRRVREGGILGLQLESHLRAGRRTLRAGRPLEYGVSITDACLGGDGTERLIVEAAEAVERSERASLAAVHSAATLRTNPESSSMRPTMPIR